MSSDFGLVHVASYANLAQAEAARMRLAMDAIPTWLGNAAMISWCWHYGNATGGVKLYVLKGCVAHALLVLSHKTVQQDVASFWNCPHCRSEVDGSWYYCWSCGTSKTGAIDPDFNTWHETDRAFRSRFRPISRERLALVLSLGALALFVCTNGSLGILAIAAIVVILASSLFNATRRDRGECAFSDPTERLADATYDSDDVELAEDDDPVDRIIVRFWAASVFSVFWSPLFLLPTAYFAFKVNNNKQRLRSIDRYRYFVSILFVVLAAILLALWRLVWGSWFWTGITSAIQVFRPPLY